jgi:ApaG protein
MYSYVATTESITIRVQPLFLEERSNILQREFFFVYFIEIENNSTEPVQLLRRHWYIHDEGGVDHEVEGDGVIGEQPLIQPGGVHKYNSFCVLQSFKGSMEGIYQMRRADGTIFDVIIPLFDLVARGN